MCLSARRLLQYLQFPDKNSRDISRKIYNFLRYLKKLVFIPLFLSEPLTTFCGTLREKLWCNVFQPSATRNTRWFKYDREKLWLIYTQIVPVIFEPPCIFTVDLLRHQYPKQCKICANSALFRNRRTCRQTQECREFRKQEKKQFIPRFASFPQLVQISRHLQRFQINCPYLRTHETYFPFRKIVY